MFVIDVLSPSDNTLEKSFNPKNVIVDEITPLIEAPQMTSFIIIPNVKLISSTNTKNECDDYDVIKYIYRIPAIRNILDILCVSSKTK